MTGTTKKTKKGEYKVGYKHPPLETRFSSTYQASPEAKKRGWQQKKRGEQVMKLVQKFQDMSIEEYLKLREDIKDNPKGHTMLEQWVVDYVRRIGKSDRLTTDWLDRIVQRAPRAVDIMSDNDKIGNVKVTIVDPKEDK